MPNLIPRPPPREAAIKEPGASVQYLLSSDMDTHISHTHMYTWIHTHTCPNVAYKVNKSEAGVHHEGPGAHTGLLNLQPLLHTHDVTSTVPHTIPVAILVHNKELAW